MHIRLKATGRCWAVNKLARGQIKLSKANNKPGELVLPPLPAPLLPHHLCTTELSIIIGRGTKYVCTNWFPMAAIACLPACLAAAAAACVTIAFCKFSHAAHNLRNEIMHMRDLISVCQPFPPHPLCCPKIVVDYWVAAVNHRLIGHHAQHSAADHTANPSQRSRWGHSNSDSDSDSDGNVAVAVVGSVCWPFA